MTAHLHLVDTGLKLSARAGAVERTFRPTSASLITRRRETVSENLAGVEDPEKAEDHRPTFTTSRGSWRPRWATTSIFWCRERSTRHRILPPRGRQTIKTHHNVGGLGGNEVRWIEPYASCSRMKSATSGGFHCREIVARHPFPGPVSLFGVLSDVTRKLTCLRRRRRLPEEIREAGLYDEIWQAFAALPAVRSVGMGDGADLRFVLGLRAVTSTDGMTADWFPFPHDATHHPAGSS